MEEITQIMETLNPAEKDVVRNIIQKVRSKESAVTELSILHAILKADMSLYGDGSEFLEMSSMVAPPLVKEYKGVEVTPLPKDFLSLSEPLDKVIMSRSSERDYMDAPMDIRELSTLLYFSSGVREYIPAYNIDKFPFRMFPSSGGLQGIELYITVNKVTGLRKGIYHYNPLDHSLELIEEGYFRRRIVNTCVKQEFINNASVVIILSCVLDRLLWKYKIRAYRYVHVDGGFVGQNIYLVATALNLGVCAISGYSDEEANQMLRIEDEDKEFVALLIALGKLKKS